MNMMRRLLLSLCLPLAFLPAARAADQAALQQADRLRLAEAFRLADWIGERLWQGWSRTPFAVLLVTKDHEFLLRHPNPGAEWRALGRDDLLGSEVLTRPRVFPVDLQATFPVDGVSTVVVGQAGQTQSGHSTAWVVMLLHEHFHQWQNAAPDYFDAVAALGLAGEDNTGMWMINYPFPYEKPEVAHEVALLGKELARTLSGAGDAPPAVAASLARLSRSVGARDFSYFDFQLWQEGVARYTELKVAELAASGYRPGAAFAALPDFQPYANVAATLRQRTMKQLAEPDLAARKRNAVYALGAGMALVLDRFDGGWKDRYARARFTMSKPVGTAIRNQGR